MKIRNMAALLSVLSIQVVNAGLTFTGLSDRAIDVSPEKSSGFEAIYVIPSSGGVKVSYEASSSNLQWQKFSASSSIMSPVENIDRDGNVYSIDASGDDIGYVISDGTAQHYFWVVNYANHEMRLDGMSLSPDSDCGITVLNVSGTAEPIRYYSLTGRPYELSREIKLQYRNLEYNNDASAWEEKEEEEILSYLHSSISVQAPLCSTSYTLLGDRFLSDWKRPVEFETETYQARAVSAETTAVQQQRDADNEKNPETNGLGGSAPCEITFTAVPTDAAVFKEWQFSRTEEFEDIFQRFPQDVLEYTFDEKGTTFVRYQCGDAAGVCFYESPIYTVSVGDSKLECPNAFSPANEDGVNDIWKVSYQSIISFECHIFNRWGTKIISFTNPAEGWDGKYKGSFVPSGVYFYVIKAKGADGKDYNLSGDINILNSRKTGGTPVAPTE